MLQPAKLTFLALCIWAAACNATSSGKGVGASCTTDSDCVAPLVCAANACANSAAAGASSGGSVDASSSTGGTSGTTSGTTGGTSSTGSSNGSSTGAASIDLQRPAGSSIAASADDDLGGALNVGSNPAVVYTIANTGSADLTLASTPVSIDTMVNCSVVITQPASTTVASGTAATFSLSITVTTVGAWSFNTNVASNDPTHPTFTFEVSGTPLEPHLSALVWNTFPAGSGDTVEKKRIAPDHAFAVPVVLANQGTAPLTLSLPVTVSAVTGGALSVRDQPPATIAPGDAATLMLLFVAPASGSGGGTVTIASNDPLTPSFSFVLQGDDLASVDAIYSSAGLLFSSNMDGATNQRVQISPNITSDTDGAGSGVSQFFHRETHAVFFGQFAGADSPTDIFWTGLLPVTRPVGNLTGLITSATTFISASTFTADDGLAFVATTSGVGALIFIDLSGSSPGGPVQLTDAPPVGGTGISGPLTVSPFGDLLAFVGDFVTAGQEELFVSDVGGTISRVSATLSAGHHVDSASVQWAGDDAHLLYETADASAQTREIYWVDLNANTATKLNGTVPAAHTGVIPATSKIATDARRVFFVSDEAYVASGGQRELYVASLVGGIGAATGVNGGAVPTGTFSNTGVTGYAIDSAGTHVLFTADSYSNTTASSNVNELFFTSVNGGTPTTTKVVTIANDTPSAGVSVAATPAFVTDTTAVYTFDDTKGGRAELFSVDLTGAPGTFTPARIGSGAFPGSSTGAFNILTSADGLSVVFESDQGSTTGIERLYSSPLASPTLTQLGANTLPITAVAPLVNQTVFFVQEANAAGPAAPATLWTNSIGHAGESKISGGEIAGANGFTGQFQAYSSTRAFYLSDDVSFSRAQCWVNDVGGAPKALSAATGNGFDSSMHFKTGEE